MSEPATRQSAEDQPRARGDRGACKPHMVHCQKCTTEAIAKQAEYNAQTQPDINTAHDTYNATRKDYRARRSDVSLQAQDLRHQIKHLVERIRCLIQQDPVVECLDRAWCEIARRLDRCEESAPELACDFDVSDDGWGCDPDADEVTYLDDDGYAELVTKITKYQDQVDKAKARFTELAGEPAALVQRVKDAKAEVDAINAALTADPATTDLKRVYAQALVARRHIRLIWHGFEQSTDFVDALCEALNCWSTGTRAVSVLTGKRAFEDCMRMERATQCTELQTNTVDEILAWYEKYCPPPDCDDPSPVDPDCPEDYDPPRPPDPGYPPDPRPGYPSEDADPRPGYPGEGAGPPDEDRDYDRRRPPDDRDPGRGYPQDPPRYDDRGRPYGREPGPGRRD